VSRSALSLALALVALASLAGFGCQSMRQTLRTPLDSPPDFQNTTIDYVDADAFDKIFETALVNRDGAITIRTPNERPDWTGRLNAWIAAWNMSKSADTRRFRGQIPVPNIDGDTLREFRLLVTAVVDRAEDASKTGVHWFREERIRSYRVELLKPYNLRFHMHNDGKIYLIFFHGAYARNYQEFLATLTDCDGSEQWSRNKIETSRCKKMGQVVQNND
jgi:hypothetical protein